MYRFLIVIITVMAFWGCKKAIQKAEANIVAQSVVKGRWKVTSYIKGATEVTAIFTPYEFQFQLNNTVDAYRNGSIEKTGSWLADIASKSITANFANANDTLTLLNGLWIIKNSTLTSVDASQTVNGEMRSLKLNQQ